MYCILIKLMKIFVLILGTPTNRIKTFSMLWFAIKKPFNLTKRVNLSSTILEHYFMKGIKTTMKLFRILRGHSSSTPNTQMPGKMQETYFFLLRTLKKQLNASKEQFKLILCDSIYYLTLVAN